MRRGWLVLVLSSLIASSLVAPTVAGHAAPEPLANEVHVLEDDARDEFYWYDGYDLHHLHVREAYWESLNTTGLVFRFTLYGGFAPAGLADALHIDISATGPDGEGTARFSTPDDTNWTSEHGAVLVSDVTQDDPPWTGVTARLQVLVPYSVFGAEVGDEISDVTMRSYAGEDLRDIAPGGIFVPMTSGTGEVPQPESQRLVDALELAGPSGYVDVELSTDGTNATLDVTNALDNGQHVSVEPAPTPGWNTSFAGPSQGSLEANDSTVFELDATPAPDATRPLPVHVVTDLGGHHVFYLGVNGTQIESGLTPASVDVAPEQPANESPGLAPILLLAGLATLAVATRHRRR